jgi:hypothetical protein
MKGVNNCPALSIPRGGSGKLAIHTCALFFMLVFPNIRHCHTCLPETGLRLPEKE